MSLLVKRGDFQMTTGVATTVLQVRGVGFQGAVVLFWWNGRDGTVDASGEASYRSGFGFASGAAARRAIALSSLHANVDGEADIFASESACIATILPGVGDPSTLEGLGDFSAWDPDGFDIIIDDAFATAFRVHYLVIGGTDLRHVFVGTYAGPASGSAPFNVDVTGLGFTPTAGETLLVAMGHGGNTHDTVAQNIIWSLGFASGPAASEQFVCAPSVGDNVATSDTYNYTRAGSMAANDGANRDEVSLAAWIADGFRLTYNWFNAPAPNELFLLVLDGGRYRVQNLLTSVTTSANIAKTGVGFGPKAAMFVSGCRAETGYRTVGDHPLCVSIGAADGATQAAVAWQDKHAQATSDLWTALDYDKVYVNPDEAATQAVEGLMALSTFDGDGYTAVMSDGDPSQCFVASVCFGDLPIGVGEDASGLIYRGAPVHYVDAEGYQSEAMLESASAAYGQAADIAVLRVAGSSVVKATLSAVPHISTAASPPYWVSMEGERTALPILVAPS